MSYYPTFPSRLGALYAFADLDTCVKVSQKYGWNVKEVKKFKLFSGMQEVRQFILRILVNISLMESWKVASLAMMINFNLD